MAHPISSEKYVSFTTYKKDGTAKALPVWIVDAGDEKVAFTTSSKTWKAKRLRANPAVLIQACDTRGNVADSTEVFKGTGVVHTDAEYGRIGNLVRQKYGFAVTMTNIMYAALRLAGKGHRSDSAIIITLDS